MPILAHATRRQRVLIIALALTIPAVGAYMGWTKYAADQHWDEVALWSGERQVSHEDCVLVVGQPSGHGFVIIAPTMAALATSTTVADTPVPAAQWDRYCPIEGAAVDIQGGPSPGSLPWFAFEFKQQHPLH
jgi:hypothetical protein